MKKHDHHDHHAHMAADFRNQQRLAATEREAVILLRTMKARVKSLNPELDVGLIKGDCVSIAFAMAAQYEGQSLVQLSPAATEISAPEMQVLTEVTSRY